MKHILRTISLAVVLVIIISSCSNETKSNKDNESVVMESERGEHTRDVGEKTEGEEDGTQFGLNDVYDVVKNGAHLILSFDAESNSFIGTVENTTSEVLEKVRVEVHLSNGIELGPTIPSNLKPGEKIIVKLPATEKEFESWSAHAEVGNSEHSHEGEGEHSYKSEGEHESSSEGEGEHK